MDLSNFCDNWEKDQLGIYHSRHESSISYPEDGNSSCFAVEDNSFWFQHRNKVIQAIVNNFAFTGTFVDVGGGNGFVSMGLQMLGYPVLLVEPGPSGARNAKNRGVEHVVQGLWGTAFVKKRSAGAIGLFDVVEHIEDDVAFLSDIHQTLADDGRIYITVPALSYLWSSEDKLAGHFRRYTTDSMKSLLQQTGYQLLYSSYFFQSLVAPIFLTRTLPSILGLRRGVKTSVTKKEHIPRESILSRMILSRLSNELTRIQNGNALKSGSSLIVVAQKQHRNAA
jgi:hypothetical protein